MGSAFSTELAFVPAGQPEHTYCGRNSVPPSHTKHLRRHEQPASQGKELPFCYGTIQGSTQCGKSGCRYASLQRLCLPTARRRVNSFGIELPQSPRAQSSLSQDLARPASSQSTKRLLEPTSDSDLLSAKRAQLTRTDVQRFGEDENAEQVAQQRPKPTPPRGSNALSRKPLIDRAPPNLPKPESSNGNADGIVVPPTPASTASRSYREDAENEVWATPTKSAAPLDSTDSSPSSGRRSGKSLVSHRRYRDTNLASNNIYLRPLHEPFPEDIADLVDYIGRDRGSPGPFPDQVRQDAELNELWAGAGEAKVEEYFRGKIFPKYGSSGSLDRADRQQMAKWTVPYTEESEHNVSTPVPDIFYGYNRNGAFPQHQDQLNSMGTEMVASNQYHGLLYPFFVIEFKGDDGSMWVATNQCLGASASCVNVAEKLNRQLRQLNSGEVRPIDSAAFSIAMNGTEARLHITWKHNETHYYMAQVKGFLLQDPSQYIKFRKYVRNIIDWGNDRRLNEIRVSLDLLEESKKRDSEAAKSPKTPSDGQAASRGKKRKSLLSRRKSSRSESAQRTERGRR